jgi:uncharacterized protein YjiS (DUF1127 family)
MALQTGYGGMLGRTASQGPAGTLAIGMRNRFGAVLAALARGNRAVQIARMHSVLNAMSDEQLQQVGVTRSGLRRHAEHLIDGEKGGH